MKNKQEFSKLFLFEWYLFSGYFITCFYCAGFSGKDNKLKIIPG